MKKTLITLMALGGVALGSTDGVQYTSTNALTLGTPLTLSADTTNKKTTVVDGIGSVSEGNDSINWTENTGNLQSWALTFTVTPELKANKNDLNATDLVSTRRADGAQGYILAANAEGELLIKTYNGSALATSESSFISAGTATTLTLTFVADVADEYYGFYNAGEAAGTVVGGTFTVFSGETAILTYSVDKSGIANTDFVKNSASLWTSSGAASINATYKYSSVGLSQLDSKIIPEPATATLSLLALAGLAARRRRAAR